MNDKNAFEEFWENIDSLTGTAFGKHLSTHAEKITELILFSLLSQEELYIGASIYKGREVASLSFDPGNTEKMLHIQFNIDESFELCFGFWNEDGLLEEYECELKETAVRLIPILLKTAMKTVMETRKGINILKNAIHVK